MKATSTAMPELVIQKIMNFAPNSHACPYSQSQPQPLMDKFNAEEITNMLDRNKIQSIDKVYKSKEDGFNLLEFVRFFLNTLYLTIALIDFFREVSQSCGYKDRLYFIDITNYICNRILDKRGEDYQIESKLIPDYRTIIPNFKIKDYLLNPPRIYSSKDEMVYKLSLNKIRIDKSKHEGVVTNCYFSSALMKVFTLDDLSDSISVYNTSCGLIKKIKPHFSKLKKDTVVLSFAYSERQQRIGAVLKDFSLNFWDNSDNFQFQKSISTATHCQEYQTNIWYFEYFNAWVTSDKTGYLYVWNIEAEKLERKIKLAYQTQVNDLTVIPCINLIAVVQERKIYLQQNFSLTCNQRKKKCKGENGQIDTSKREIDHENPTIYLYDFLKGEIVTKIELGPENRNPHTLQYSENYQVLLSAGYEKKISIFQINKSFLDTSKIGELTGHESLITSFTVIKKSPMVISADDKGKVKIWDIRNYKCVQTLDFRDKTNITKLLDMIELGKIGVLGSRINFVEFDQKAQIQKRIQFKQKVAPLWIECDHSTQELIILTKKDLRVIDIKKGVVKNIYCQFHTEDIEITFFKYFQSLHKFIIGNQKGQSKLYCLRTGRFDGKLMDHTSSIIQAEYDQQNKIFITIGQDSAIQVQKQQCLSSEKENRQDYQHEALLRLKQENDKALHKQLKKKKVQNSGSAIVSNDKNLVTKIKLLENTPKTDPSIMLLRQMKNNFYGRQITLSAISIYHGFIAVGSACEKRVYIWDYEFAKLLIELNLSQALGNHAEITFLLFINGYSILIIGTSEGIAYFVRIQKLDQNYKIKTIGKFISLKQQPITSIITDLLIKGFAVDSETFVHCKIYFGQVSGYVSNVNISKQLGKIKQEASVVHKESFNAERQLRQNFIIQIQKQKYQSCTVNPQLDQNIIGVLSMKNNRKYSEDDYINEEKDTSCQISAFQAHKGNLSGLNIIQLDQSYLMTIGLDERVKVWAQNSLICDGNINLPLPFKWDIEIKSEQKKKDKIMFALKIIQELFEKYGNQISINQSKFLKVRKLLDIVKSQIQNEQENQQKFDGRKDNFITEPMHRQRQRLSQKKIILFQNEFTKKDMYYDNVKKFNFNEVAGPTLREIEVQKKLQLIQKEWTENKSKVQQDKNKLLMVIRNRAQKNQQKQQILQFLEPRNSKAEKIKDQQIPQSSLFVKNIMSKVQLMSVPKTAKKQINVNFQNTGNGTSLGLTYKMTNLLQRSKNTALQIKSLRSEEQSQWRDCMQGNNNFSNNNNNNNHSNSINNKIKQQALNRVKSSGCTFEKYFEQKQQQGPISTIQTDMMKLNLNLNQKQKNYEDFNLTRAKTSNNFRNILNKMSHKVKQSKKKKMGVTAAVAQMDGDCEQERINTPNYRIFALASSNGRRNCRM